MRGLIERFDGLVQNIEDQFERVLKQHEADFIAAYRVSEYNLTIEQSHMLRVKKELQRLRKEKDEAAGKLSNDDSITSLKA